MSFLDQIMDRPVTSHLLDYVTIEFQSIIPCVESSHSTEMIPLRRFIESMVRQSKTSTGTLISTLSYARRLKKQLSRTSRGIECTLHRIFLASLIITHKYLHDHALKNKYWLVYADMFTAHEINLMEKQLLQLLDYNLTLEGLEDIEQDIVRMYYTREYRVDPMPSCLPSLPPLIPSIL
ncbi:hypothetical protein BY458DRAFT_514937 [Sporodiniella umbellata]|nr:hypothetical protein BY458DRAFT_514937 [Sporodiniella umbellata]